MPAIRLSDRFGLDVDLQPAPFSALARYAQALPHLVVEGADLTRIGGLRLDDPAVTSAQIGLSFKEPVEFGTKLTVQAGLQGSFAVHSGSVPDDYGDNLEIPEGDRYLSVGLTASAGGGAFGAAAGATVTLTNYRRFPAGMSLLEALREAIGGFLLPAGAEDLAEMPEGAAVSVTTGGSVKFSGTANLLAAANPLATVNLPAPIPQLEVMGGASVQLGASCEVSGEYQVRVQKLGGDRVRLGWYRKRGAELAIKAGASAGLAAGPAGADLFSSIVSALSGSAQAGQQELQRAGLSPAQIAAIQGAVTAGVERTLELALSFELGALETGQAAFLYEIEPGALDAAGTRALAQALAGDLSPLTENEGALPAGIGMVRSLFSALRQGRHTLKVNLLGIYNFISVTKLALAGRVLYDAVTGDLLITDIATAERVRAGAVNFGADAAKLRHVLAESFLITAAYRGSRSVVPAPALKSSHAFFELREKTGPDRMRTNLRVGAALGLLSAVTMPEIENFGRTTVYAETQYDDALTRALFLDGGGQPRVIEEYENAGRGAIQLLVPEDAEDAFRRRPAIDDALWQRMKDAGQPGFAVLFPELNEAAVQAIAADYSTIVWWAEAMRRTGELLARMHAGPAELRERLAEHLKQVAATTREEFGQPWGLVAMDLVSNRRAGARIQITGSRLALSGHRSLTVAAQ